jgi:hypothetical protein
MIVWCDVKGYFNHRLLISGVTSLSPMLLILHDLNWFEYLMVTVSKGLYTLMTI